MKICPHCQLQNYDNAQVCPRCNFPFYQFEQPRQVQYPQQSYQQQQPPQQEDSKKERKKPGKAVSCLVAFALICIIIVVIIALSSGGDSNRVTGGGSGAKVTATVNYTKQTVEAYPLLGAEYKKISDMTDIQKEPYLRDMMGKEYRIVGGITEVRTDGTIQLQLKNSTFMAISMVKGYPSDRLMEITNDDTLDFIGRVSETSTLLYLNITTDFIRDTEKY